jgi:excinuclease ABC subunit C
MITKESIDHLPHAVGLYFFKQGDEFVYIGKSIDIKSRVVSHIERGDFDAKERAMCEQSDRVEFKICNSEFVALIEESKLIQTHRPKYNVIWKDDKSYLYIKIEVKSLFPRISLVRKENDGSSLYFGPFSSTRSIRFLLKQIRLLFPFCMAKQPLKKPCFYAHIGLCNPCPGSAHDNTELTQVLSKQYKHNIRKVIKILEGHTEIIEKGLRTELKKYKSAEQFEEAIVVRNKLLSLDNLIHLRSFSSFEQTGPYDHEKALSRLATLLHISVDELHRIECYDISNLMQQQATASMVVATNGIIDKGEYRRFKIHTTGVSDFKMIAEALSRRFHNTWTTPSLLVIDGGSPQVVTAERVVAGLGKQIRIIGLAKRPDRVVFLTENGTKTIRPRREDEGFRLLQQLRDEAHRFAKKYHIHLRSKNYFENTHP